MRAPAAAAAATAPAARNFYCLRGVLARTRAREPQHVEVEPTAYILSRNNKLRSERRNVYAVMRAFNNIRSAFLSAIALRSSLSFFQPHTSLLFSMLLLLRFC